MRQVGDEHNMSTKLDYSTYNVFLLYMKMFHLIMYLGVQVSLFLYYLSITKVRIEGSVEKVTEAESDEYFNSRPRPSQIGACVSDQSKPIASRQVLVLFILTCWSVHVD